MIVSSPWCNLIPLAVVSASFLSRVKDRIKSNRANNVVNSLSGKFTFCCVVECSDLGLLKSIYNAIRAVVD